MKDNVPSAIKEGAPPATLNRVLGTPSLVLFGLTYMLPLTVFTTYGIVTQITGGRVAAAYILTLAAMIFTARSYARMVTAYPQAGSAYVYTQRSFGGSAGFLVGWSLLLDYLFMPMLCYLVIGIYLGAAFPNVPQWVFVIGSILLITTLNLAGIVSVARANVAIVAIQFVFIAVFIALTIGSRVGGTVDLLAPFVGDGSTDGLGSLVAGAAVLCLSFLGFDSVSTLAEEARDARKSVPRAILIVTISAGVLYIILAYVSQIAFPSNDFKDADSAALDVAAAVGGQFLTTFFVAAYVAGCVGSALTSQAAVGRLLFAMSRDGVLPKFLSYVSPKFRTPRNAFILVSLASLFALVIDLALLSEMISFGALIAFSAVNLSVIKHFYFDQKNRGPQGLFVNLLIPTIGFGLTVWLWTNLSNVAFTAGLIWVGVGIIGLAVVTRGFRRPAPMIRLDAGV